MVLWWSIAHPQRNRIVSRTGKLVNLAQRLPRHVRLNVSELAFNAVELSINTVQSRCYRLQAQNDLRTQLFEFSGDAILIHLRPSTGRRASHGVTARRSPCGGAGGLSAKTIVQHHRVLRHALKTAHRWGLISGNPADLVTPPGSLARKFVGWTRLNALPCCARLRGRVSIRSCY